MRTEPASSALETNWAVFHPTTTTAGSGINLPVLVGGFESETKEQAVEGGVGWDIQL